MQPSAAEEAGTVELRKKICTLEGPSFACALSPLVLLSPSLSLCFVFLFFLLLLCVFLSVCCCCCPRVASEATNLLRGSNLQTNERRETQNNTTTSNNKRRREETKIGEKNTVAGTQDKTIMMPLDACPVEKFTPQKESRERENAAARPSL